MELCNSIKHKVLQFLFLSTSTKNTQSRYMDVLAEIALLFPYLKSIEDRIYYGWVVQCVCSFTSHHCTFPIAEKCKQVMDCYHKISLQTWSYKLTGRGLQVKNNAEIKYQTVQFLVFHYWLKFNLIREICWKVGTGLKDTSLHNQKSKKRKRKPNTNDVSTMSIFRVPQQMKLQGQLPYKMKELMHIYHSFKL